MSGRDESAILIRRRVLLVEDNPGDVALLRKFLGGHPLIRATDVARDGDEALAMLRGEGDGSDAERPDLILLDLNLPRTSGFEVLQQIKADPELRAIPVVVLTSSAAREDVLRCYGAHANSYVRKPARAAELQRVLDSLCNYWLETATLSAHSTRR